MCAKIVDESRISMLLDVFNRQPCTSVFFYYLDGSSKSTVHFEKFKQYPMGKWKLKRLSILYYKK